MRVRALIEMRRRKDSLGEKSLILRELLGSLNTTKPDLLSEHLIMFRRNEERRLGQRVKVLDIHERSVSECDCVDLQVFRGAA